MTIAFTGTVIGMLFAKGLDNEAIFILAIFLLLMGVIFHFTLGQAGFYASLSINSIGIGMLLTAILQHFEVFPELRELLLSFCILLAIYIAIIYLSSIEDGDLNSKWYGIGIFVTIISYIIISYIFVNVDILLIKIIFTMQHVGVFYMIAMWATGYETEKLLRNCSIASFSLLAITAVVALLVLSDGKMKFNSASSVGSRRNPARYHHHHRTSNAFLYGSALSNNNRNDRYDNEPVHKSDEKDEVYPNENIENTKEVIDKKTKEEIEEENKKSQEYDLNEWDM